MPTSKPRDSDRLAAQTTDRAPSLTQSVAWQAGYDAGFRAGVEAGARAAVEESLRNQSPAMQERYVQIRVLDPSRKPKLKLAIGIRNRLERGLRDSALLGEVVDRVRRGEVNKEIADKMRVDLATVKRVRARAVSEGLLPTRGAGLRGVRDEGLR